MNNQPPDSRDIPTGTLREPKHPSFLPLQWNLYAILILTCIAIYYPVLTFKSIDLDDKNLIGAFETGHYGLAEAFSCNAFMLHKATDFYRPLQSVTFIADAAIAGGSTVPYHLTNVILHCLTVCCLLQLLLLFGFNRRLSVAASLVFAASPLFAQAVAWVPARGDLLLGLFGIISLASLLKFRNSGHGGHLAFHGVALFLATLSKESALLLPILFAAYLVLADHKQIFRRRNYALVPIWVFACCSYLVLRHFAMNGLPGERTFGLLPLIGNLRTLPETLTGFLIPYNIPVLPSFTFRSTLAGSIAAAGIAAMLGIQGKLAKPAVIFGTLWFVVLSIPGMMYTVNTADHFYDYLLHRSYLPMVGIIIVLAEMVPAAWFGAGSKRYFIPPAVVLTIALAFLARHQADYFADKLSFYQEAVRHNYGLGNSNAFNGLGAASMEAGRMDEAIGWYLQALKIKETNEIVHFNLANALMKAGRPGEAVVHYQRATVLNPHYLQAYNNLGSAFIQINRPDLAAGAFRQALDIDPSSMDLLNNLAQAYVQYGKFAEAIEATEKALELAKSACDTATARNIQENLDELKETLSKQKMNSPGLPPGSPVR
jgi:tetratricopeptide (TPR) repeat protein